MDNIPTEEPGKNDNLSTVPARWVTNSLLNESLMEKQVSHYDKIEKHLTKLPQFKDSEEFFECLAHFTDEAAELTDLSRFEDQFTAESESHKYEVIIENQRGATMLGIPMYSKESLLYPLDPPKFQTLKGHAITSLNLYPLPSKSWKWSWNHWYILMIKDVDQEGWVYSHIRFGSRKWKGIGRFGNFVRRRVWVRKREMVPDLEQYSLHLPTSLTLDGKHIEEEFEEQQEIIEEQPEKLQIPVIVESNDPSESSSTFLEYDLLSLFSKLNELKIDRLKIEEILRFLFNSTPETLSALIANYNGSDETSWLLKMMSQLQFNQSKKTFLQKFESKLDFPSDTSSKLYEIYRICEMILTDSFYDSQRRQMIPKEI
ncbi:hypothetical protein OGAPHI_005635 [Ogataea philodendri]|uniref:Peroxin/Ferlin domain-containing protein n=1 Tax=Ogataea philodendri TaxID=1378263 RepID=A0A9P8NYR9_9ASCO|nr:uncharacterized protein OGAPHI_005635 [Ogataea philodendri]KAH3662383.1 hypothetical protein OGAPHI_005635 [Ogataea philodendri]